MTKYYHNWSGFVDCISKDILVFFFGSQCTYCNYVHVQLMKFQTKNAMKELHSKIIITVLIRKCPVMLIMQHNTLQYCQ